MTTNENAKVRLFYRSTCRPIHGVLVGPNVGLIGLILPHRLLRPLVDSMLLCIIEWYIQDNCIYHLVYTVQDNCIYHFINTVVHCSTSSHSASLAKIVATMPFFMQ
jgi:hypothetical protein